MNKRGFFFDLTDEMENNGNVHREVVSQIEALRHRNLVCYYANPGHPGGALQDHDPDLLENVLRSLDLDRYQRSLDLLVSSPGGSSYAAAKMVKVCYAFANQFGTIVLDRAMSAATLVCLGSQQLLMGQTASLGPIDPQMVRGNRLVPAHVIVDSFKNMLRLAQEAVTQGQPADPFLHVLKSLDVTLVQESIKATNATKAIAIDLLANGLLRGEPAKAGEVVEDLVKEGQTELHGKHMYPDVLQELGLPIEILPVGSEVDGLLRELLVRIGKYAGQKGLAKYLVTYRGGIDVQVQIRKMS